MFHHPHVPTPPRSATHARSTTPPPTLHTRHGIPNPCQGHKKPQRTRSHVTAYPQTGSLECRRATAKATEEETPGRPRRGGRGARDEEGIGAAETGEKAEGEKDKVRTVPAHCATSPYSLLPVYRKTSAAKAAEDAAEGTPTTLTPCVLVPPSPPLFFFDADTFYRSERILVESGMAIAPPQRVRDGNLSHMPPPPITAGNRERRVEEDDDAESGDEDDDAESGDEDTSSSRGEGESSSSSSADADGDETNSDEIESSDKNENSDDTENSDNIENGDDIENSGDNEKSNKENSKDNDADDGETPSRDNITSTPTIEGHAITTPSPVPVQPTPTPSHVPVQPTPSHVSVQPTPTLSHQPIQGSDAPTTTILAAGTSSNVPGLLEQSSEISTTALEHHGAGKLSWLYIFTFYLSFRLLVTPMIPNQGMLFIFICFYMDSSSFRC